MDDKAHSPAISASAQENSPAPGPRRSFLVNFPRWYRWGNYATVGFLIFLVLAVAVVWLSPYQPVGRSIPWMVTVSAAIVATAVSWLWLVCFSPFSSGQVMGYAGALAIVVLGLAGSVRRIDLTGDIFPVVEFRWNPSREERVRQHLAVTAAQAHDLPAVEIPIIAAPEDAPAYRGAARDGVVIGPPLREDWTEHPPTALWEADIGEGYSAFACVGDRLVTLEQRGPQEALTCYDAKTGLQRWAYEWESRFDEGMGGPGPRSTPTIAGDRVYALGANGDLICCDLATGKLVWKINALKENQLQNSHWAMTSSPLIHDGLVIVNVGGPQGTAGPLLAAYNKQTGNLVWKSTGVVAMADEKAATSSDHQAVPGENGAGYSSPVLVKLAEVEQIVILDGFGLRGCDPANGQQLWFHPFKNDPLINVAQPLFFEKDRIFLSASYLVGCEMLQISCADEQWAVKSLWASKALRCKFTSPIAVDERIYGLDEGIMVCVDAQSGNRLWKGGRCGHGQLLLTNGRLLVLTEAGDAVLLRPNPQKYDELARFPALSGAKNWNPPTLVRGRLYVRNHLRMAAFDLR